MSNILPMHTLNKYESCSHCHKLFMIICFVNSCPNLKKIAVDKLLLRVKNEVSVECPPFIIVVWQDIVCSRPYFLQYILGHLCSLPPGKKKNMFVAKINKLQLRNIITVWKLCARNKVIKVSSRNNILCMNLPLLNSVNYPSPGYRHLMHHD